MLRLLTILALLTSVNSTSIAGPAYQIIPRALDDSGDPGFSVASGFIETDGTIGPLVPGNFLTWQIEVTGPFGTTLTEQNSFIAINFLDAVATTSMGDLSVITPGGTLTVVGNGATVDNCGPCFVQLTFEHFNNGVDTPFALTDYFGGDGMGTNWQAAGRDFSGPINVIASVPEPSSFAFLSLIGVAISGATWWKKRYGCATAVEPIG